MDNFLKKQTIGQEVDVENPFTVDRARSRETMLASRPRAEYGTILRLLDGAIADLGYQPQAALRFRQGTQYWASCLSLSLPGVGRERIADFLAELRDPFGARGGATRLAQAILLAVFAAPAHINWGGSILQPDLLLQAKTTKIPQLGRSKGDLNIAFYGVNLGLKRFRSSLLGRTHGVLQKPEVLLPLESASRTTEGFFEHRTRPFTAIRTYAPWSGEESESGMLLDLWPGPYSMIDEQTAVLDQREPGRFLFLRWRPNYGFPTLLHHSLDGPLEFGQQSYRGTFWVESSDRPAQVHLFSPPMLSERILVKGPAGLSGVVLWPGLTFDVWGSHLVQNDELERAMAWTQQRVDLTAHKLSTHIELVAERLRDGNLITSSLYLKETIERARRLWGQQSS